MKNSTRLLAILALGTASAAFAQGNPPTTAVPNPATGAGQQAPTPAGGPMGTTGTPTAQPGMQTPPPPPPAAGMPPPAPRDPAPMRPARADRN